MSSRYDPFVGDDEAATEVTVHPQKGHLMGVVCDIDHLTTHNESIGVDIFGCCPVEQSQDDNWDRYSEHIEFV